MKALAFRLAAVLSMLLLVASCDKDGGGENEEEVDTYEATIEFSSSTMVTLDYEEGSIGNITFSCDHQWSLEIPEEATWFSVSKTSGKSTKVTMVTFTATETNSGARRTATCTLVSGSTKKSFTVAQDMAALILEESDVEDYDKYYKPQEFNYDMLRSDSQWSFCRSKQSEHFIVFWEKEYGAYGLYGEKAGVENTSPSTLDSSNDYYVDIDDLLEKAEIFYDLNINKLKFAVVGEGKSNLDKYKIEIYILHQTEWLATGGGYDDVIGALWINPGTCKPVGSTIAHEIGHSFQYMVYADKVANGAANDYSTGFRYGNGQGSGFWEQCANWQAYQVYAAQAFNSTNFSVFTENCQRHFIHEHQRYASYFFQWYWTEKYGMDAVSNVWRASEEPKDAVEAYMSSYGLSLDELNGQLWEYAAKCATWDFDVTVKNYAEGSLSYTEQTVREFGADYIGKIGWSGNYDESTGYYSVDASRAPEATGFNLIRLNVPAEGETVSLHFVGIPNADGYQTVSNPSIAGWHVGFVSLAKDGTRTYSEPVRITSEGDASIVVPAGCEKLWAVVSATPTEYMSHTWDEDDTNDEVWPYKIKLSDNTDLFGNIKFTGDEKPSSITIEHNITTSASAGYSGTAYALDEDELVDLAYAFVMQPSEIVAGIPSSRDDVQSGTVKVAAVEPDGSLSYNFTANGYGFWYAADGSVESWSSAYTYCEFTPSSWTFQFGIHPTRYSEGSLKVGDVYTDKIALVYGNYTATLVFNITITD